MPSCAVKWCINQSHLHRKNVGITFHVFPQEHNRRQLWTKAVRLERQQNEWTPSKKTRICSIHFRNDDFYASKKGYTKLKTNAIPICTMVFSIEKPIQSTPLETLPSNLTPVTENSKEVLTDENVINKPFSELFSKSRKRHLVACPSCGCEFGVPVDSATEDIGRLMQLSPSNDLKILKTRCGTPLYIRSSEVESALNTPKAHRLENLIRRKTLLSEKRLNKIRNLKLQYKRLLKKCISLKDVTTALKKNKLVQASAQTSVAEIGNYLQK